MKYEFMAEGTRACQSVTPDWRSVNSHALDGVLVKEVAHIPLNNGYGTELLRADWLPDNTTIAQVFQRVLQPGAISAWHRHAHTTDRLFCVSGLLLVVLFDGRSESPTQGEISEYRIGPLRPTLIAVPPGIWHGVKNISTEPAMLINMVDVAYDYHAPDHWCLPVDTIEIDYLFP